MEHMSFDDIVSAVSGKVILKGKYADYKNISTDSRKLQPGDIFIALKGEKFNGNEYVESASKRGASLCIIDEVKFQSEEIGEFTTIIKVENGNTALLELAEFYRSRLDVKIIGVTGSVGKTTTKDIIAAVLGAKFKVFKTEGNFNNQIGLPHMLFKLDNSYEVAVLEMGMNQRGEIHNMVKAARPDIAVITNVLRAHIGNLGSRKNILNAKLEITDFFSKENILIINSDNDLLSTLEEKNFTLNRVGLGENSDVSAYDIVLEEDCIEFKVYENNVKTEEKFLINMPGKYNIVNSLLAISCGRLLNMSYDEIREGIENIKLTSMRMEIIREKKFTIINDCYNANPESMKAAIDVLKGFKSSRKIAVLGTMGELGEEAYKMHQEVGMYAGEKDIDLLIGIGEYKKDFERGFKSANKKGNFMGFDKYEDLTDFILKYIERGDTILVKASRFMKFEIIIETLKKSSSY
ncbi:UDP-N-acetylmuramoyl-tripeptide--D-alanyl-D-alanine ligase [Clostridium kluyveri]|uniref:UDP-N-acetylmuramoyl-tripeptide--D-alanyl-D-alanine ligase n=1 Tax=Clostridium kluyveri TaxID=1534 RepID=A0A1L5F6D2_CLOKL|nr:UDP-N-acetylmuramoyl-tripeptide--D-alanyl-D-alanine ligase [Clostridium kluyveri]APM38571.1 UDP-N-acetylmuramoyl-tripeptide--D-alanyl-D-alanine ligase [Clostridium kluyveri]UZQ50870.1 UDP-N-acetylmuramoyl-tripeptide--D-alanyl-D-alanine ligase [Clostridium kluyveri]